MYSRIQSQRPLLRYGFVLLAGGAGLLLDWGLVRFFGDYAHLIALLPAVAFAAWFCGLGPSIATIVFALSVMGFYRTQIGSSMAFLLAGCLIIAIAEASHRMNLALQKSQGELEDRVRERTADLDSANHNLRGLSARLMQLQDDERRRLARELHDSVGQMLVGLTLNLSAVRAEIERLHREASKLIDSEALVQEMTREVRTMSYLLHPPLLDEAGLASALRWYVDGFAERSKIEVDLDLPHDLGRFSSELETALFRVVQECLTNIHRHSQSPVAIVCIVHVGRDGVRLEVQDKGGGMSSQKQIELSSAGTPGVGIRGMRERIRQLGGSLDIKSDAGGTMVVVQLPTTVGAAATRNEVLEVQAS